MKDEKKKEEGREQKITAMNAARYAAASLPNLRALLCRRLQSPSAHELGVRDYYPLMSSRLQRGDLIGPARTYSRSSKAYVRLVAHVALALPQSSCAGTRSRLAWT